jgi:hypothetical protein
MRKFIVFILVSAACTQTAHAPQPDLGSAPDLAPTAAERAANEFWAAFSSQDYASLPVVRGDLQAVYDSDPHDPGNTLLLGHANLWTLAEFGRDPRDPSQLPSRAMDALRYFGEAAQLAPDDQRIPGWLGSVEFAIGNITSNDALVTQGRQHIDAGVGTWPEFNLFVRAFINGQLPVSQPEFATAIDDLWKTLDLCAGETVDRVHPDYTKYLSRRTTDGPQRVCWNDAKAAHNLEGFFLYMGDLLVKSGDPTTAVEIYGNAQKLDSYGQWPFGADLEQRIKTASDRAALYRDADPMNDPPLANQTPTTCANCHAAK